MIGKSATVAGAGLLFAFALGADTDLAENPFWLNAVGACVVVAAFVGAYELVGHALGWIFSIVLPARSVRPPNVSVDSRTASAERSALTPGRAILTLVAFLAGQTSVWLVIGIRAAFAGSDAEAVQREFQHLAPVGIPASAIVGALVLALLYFRHTRKHPIDDLRVAIGWIAAPGRHLLVGALVGMSLALIYFLTAAWLVPIPDDATPGVLARTAGESGLPRASVAMSALLLAPILEETLFRGVFLGAMLRVWKPVAAVALVSGVFVLLHLPENWYYWPAILGVTGMAVAAAMLRIRTGSLAPAVALHVGYNAVLVGWLYLLHGA